MGRSSTTGMVSFHQRTLGSRNSLTMLNVWSVTSTVVINDVDSMMKTNFPMVVQNVNDVILMMLTDTTVKTQPREPSRSLLVSVNGLNDTFHNVLVNVNTNIKLTE